MKSTLEETSPYLDIDDMKVGTLYKVISTDSNEMCGIVLCVYVPDYGRALVVLHETTKCCSDLIGGCIVPTNFSKFLYTQYNGGIHLQNEPYDKV